MNRLADATSPYLRQHAENPVEWYPWGPEALARARAEDRPILLSVGYSACHWCHVMAHESFEDPATAALMNRAFINIKVDREERPDIDAIYQKVVQLMGLGGGWPLTVFLTPDLRPFYGGTYFPPTPSYGRPGFGQLLEALAEAFRERRDQVEAQAESFMEGIAELAGLIDEESAKAPPNLRIAGLAALADAGRRILARVDLEWGGIGRQPKFPNATALELLLTMARDEQSRGLGPAGPASGALRRTLEKMWRGGIYDHLRGGFARYATDRIWLVPHFEKMLYDNAQLVGLYAEAALLWPDLAFARPVVEETIEYLVADMRGPGGTFYSATDADSEGVEGKYFCWTPREIDQVLGEAAGRRFAAAHGVSAAGNFEHGMSILHRPRPLADVAAELEIAEDALRDELARSRAALLERRYTRTPPLRDDKLLTAWNALLISGLCRAASAAEGWGAPAIRDAWLALARAAAEHLLDTHVSGDMSMPRVLRCEACPAGELPGYLDDLAFLARALLDLHELTFEPRWLAGARALARHALAHHTRSGGDGFYLTADDAEVMIERVESQHDAAIPSGLGVIVEVLLRLEHLGEASAGARAAVEATLLRYRTALDQPIAFASLLRAAMWAAPEAAQVTLRGPSPAAVAELAALVRRERLRQPQAIGLGFEVADEVAAVVCREQVCTTPLSDPNALRIALVG
ncbi:MAG: thioredoxin domain-containing protein [Myxococcales bacterium]|nr:thioredoxin domain-containing protein [Myxococcales bacterium]